jgi:adenine deaminase
MARAANIMREIGGGIVVVDGENVEQWELSLVGIYTASPFADAQREFLRINQAIRNLGAERTRTPNQAVMKEASYSSATKSWNLV